MVFVPVTDREQGSGKGETAQTPADAPYARTRSARARDRIVAAYASVTHSGESGRVAAKRFDPYAGVAATLSHDDDPPAPVVDRPPGWWQAGPAGPGEQAVQYLGWYASAREQSTPLAVALLVLLIPVFLLGVASSALAWLTQHLAVFALVAVVVAVLAGGVFADGSLP